METSRCAVLIVAAVTLAGCARPISQSELRLEAQSAGGRKWVRVTAPPSALMINTWIDGCAGDVEVIYQSPRVASFACRQPGATRYASFRLADGRHLALDDIVQPSALATLQAAADKALRKRGQPAVAVPADVALNAQGLIFFAEGGDVVIPQTDLRPMVKPEAALLVGR